MTGPRRRSPLWSALIVAALLAGCSGSNRAGGAGAAVAGYPVTVTSCGTPVTYHAAPVRAVSNDINTMEDMLALGLGPRMVGDFGVRGDGPAEQPLPPAYKAAFAAVPDISDGYFTLEKLVGLRPDFLFAGWNYGLQAGTNLTPAHLARYGINTLVLSESCAAVQRGLGPITIGDTYQDLRNLGAIFNVRQRAAQVISAMQAQVAAVHAKVDGLSTVTVFDYDSGQAAPFTGAGLATPTALIALAGGRNILAGLHKAFTSVSWEQVVAADPQCIIVNDYGSPTAAQKEAFLETSPVTRNLGAVKRHCFLALSYDQITPSPRNAEAVVAIARWLHPEAWSTTTTNGSRP